MSLSKKICLGVLGFSLLYSPQIIYGAPVSHVAFLVFVSSCIWTAVCIYHEDNGEKLP